MWSWSLTSERGFCQQFAAARETSTTKFLFLHNFVTFTYIRTVTSLAAQVVLFAGSVLPLLYWLVFKRQRVQHRTAVALVVRITHLLAAMSALSTDWDVGVHAPPLVLFKMLVLGRVFGSLCTALGLQLPLWQDLPLQTATLAAVLATATPRQCGLPSPALAAFNTSLDALPPTLAAAAAAALNAETAAAAAVAPSAPTLFSYNQPFFGLVADVLDWPFAMVGVRPGALSLSRPGLCTAVYCWVQLVLGLGVPAAVLWAADRRERAAWLRSARARGGGGSGRGEGVSAAGRMEDPHPDSSAPLTAAGRAGGVPWLYVAFWAQMCWCLLRTACQLAL